MDTTTNFTRKIEAEDYSSKTVVISDTEYLSYQGDIVSLIKGNTITPLARIEGGKYNYFDQHSELIFLHCLNQIAANVNQYKTAERAIIALESKVNACDNTEGIEYEDDDYFRILWTDIKLFVRKWGFDFTDRSMRELHGITGVFLFALLLLLAAGLIFHNVN